MSKRVTLLLVGLCLSIGLGISTGDGQETKLATSKPRLPDSRPKVEVVFCLDTTGSMGGLIDNAKKKIWSIANQISSGNPNPYVRIGLVAYRDRGDDYITKVIDLTDDMDTLHEQLMAFQAQGGGDTPESVNQALYDAVTKIRWSKDERTFRMIFLVGDAPPHMDYPDDVKYPDTCKLAAKADIIINAVQCGKDSKTSDAWHDICKLSAGDYVQLDAKGGAIRNIPTPFDEELAKLNTDMSKNTLVFGNLEQQAAGQRLQTSNMGLAKESVTEAADKEKGER